MSCKHCLAASDTLDRSRSACCCAAERAAHGALQLLHRGFSWILDDNTSTGTALLLRRAGGAVPATIAVLEGVPHVGLTQEQLQHIAKRGPAVRRSSKSSASACFNTHPIRATHRHLEGMPSNKAPSTAIGPWGLRSHEHHSHHGVHPAQAHADAQSSCLSLALHYGGFSPDLE